MTGLVLSSLLLLSSINNVFGGRGYVGVSEKLDGFHAEQYCRNEYGSNLATITSAQENEDAREACREVSPVTGECYIGLVRDSAFDEWQFTSSNIDSTPRGYSNWNKLCAIFSSLRNGRWDAEPCDNTVRKYPFVCDSNWADPQSYCDIEFTAWYRADNYNEDEWKDLSGNGLDSPLRAGEATCLTDDKGLNGEPVVAGNTATQFLFGPKLVAEYSFFSVARYAPDSSSGQKRRIFDGDGSNWLSGFWEARTGIAHHNGWITDTKNELFPDKWIISSDSQKVYRANGIIRTINNNGNAAPGQVRVNYGERSNFEIAEVIMVNGIAVDATKMSCIEDYLSKRYDIAVESTYDGKSSASLVFMNFNEGEGDIKEFPDDSPKSLNYFDMTEKALLYIIAALIAINVVCIARYCIHSRKDHGVKYKTVRMESETDADV